MEEDSQAVRLRQNSQAVFGNEKKKKRKKKRSRNKREYMFFKLVTIDFRRSLTLIL